MNMYQIVLVFIFDLHLSVALVTPPKQHDSGYKSTTYHPIPCRSDKCNAYRGRCGNNNTCQGYAYTHLSKGRYTSQIIEDEIFLYTRPKNSYKVLQYPLPNFPFGCTIKAPLKGLSANAEGILTLGKVDMALHSLISKTFKVPHKFALCLPSTNTILYKGFQGALYFGGGPYRMSKENRIDFSKFLVTTPIVPNPKSKNHKSIEYFIDVKSIEIEGTPLKLDNKNIVATTKISTLTPYTMLHTKIYEGLKNAFTTKAKAMGIPRVEAVAPFGACYNSSHIANVTSGPKVPTIDFVLEGNNKRWRLYGPNLMVKLFDIKYIDVLCLGIVDGGTMTTNLIVIGGKQMEDNIVEFDLEGSKVGFSSTPTSMGLSCSQFQSTLPTF
ncbi:hypothetical protein RND81_12G072000 [Saponaria officinalis]|uniref:Peptidase A1 domain-containing protein n=1 Tax=Saponaria officinalis TaxID=3572 RepID=A0AAW1H7L4_SAPOF